MNPRPGHSRTEITSGGHDYPERPHHRYSQIQSFVELSRNACSSEPYPRRGRRGGIGILLVTFPPFFGMGRQQTTDLDWTEQASHRATLRFGMCQCLHRLISLALHHRQVLIEAQDGDASYNDREKSLQ